MFLILDPRQKDEWRALWGVPHPGSVLWGCPDKQQAAWRFPTWDKEPVGNWSFTYLWRKPCFVTETLGEHFYLSKTCSWVPFQTSRDVPSMKLRGLGDSGGSKCHFPGLYGAKHSWPVSCILHKLAGVGSHGVGWVGRTTSVLRLKDPAIGVQTWAYLFNKIFVETDKVSGTEDAVMNGRQDACSRRG